jgi:hypothetical protein
MQPFEKDSLIYRSGDVFLGPRVRRFLEYYHLGNTRSLIYVSNWSFVHLFSGVFTAWVLIQYFPDYDFYVTGFNIHTLWEIWQIIIGMTKVHTSRGAIDIIVDTAFFMTGMWIYSLF